MPICRSFDLRRAAIFRGLLATYLALSGEPESEQGPREGAEPVTGEGTGRLAALEPEASRRLIEEFKRRQMADRDGGGGFVVGQASPDGRYEVYKLGKSPLERLERIGEEAEREAAGVLVKDGAVHVVEEGGPKSFPEEYFFRRSPFREMAGLGARMFTIFRAFPVIKADGGRGGSSRAEAGKAGPEEPPRATDGSRTPGGAYVFLVPAAALERPAGVAGFPLPLSDSERERILDELMAMNQSRQLEAFRARYLDPYDLDQESLAGLTRGFLFTNMNSVFFVAGSFSTAFDFVEELYYKRAVYDLFASYGARSPETRTGVEILFYLASTYDFERRALEKLIMSRDELGRVILIIRSGLASRRSHWELRSCARGKRAGKGRHVRPARGTLQNAFLLPFVGQRRCRTFCIIGPGLTVHWARYYHRRRPKSSGGSDDIHVFPQ